MEECKQKSKKDGGLLRRTWERCKSFNNIAQDQRKQPNQQSTHDPHAIILLPIDHQPIVKSKSWSSIFPPSPTPTSSPRANKWAGSKKPKVSCPTPKGCLSIYVGPDRQRFVIKIEFTSHPLFKKLLEEAELEFGYNCNGPIVLPCDVEMFTRVLDEMDADLDQYLISHMGCSPKKSSSYHLLSPSSTRLVSLHQLV